MAIIRLLVEVIENLVAFTNSLATEIKMLALFHGPQKESLLIVILHAALLCQKVTCCTARFLLAKSESSV